MLRRIKHVSMDDINLTGEQIRAARALLNWSRGDLADAIYMSPSTVDRLEKGAVPQQSVIMVAARSVFEAAGIQFVGGGAQWRQKQAAG